MDSGVHSMKEKRNKAKIAFAISATALFLLMLAAPANGGDTTIRIKDREIPWNSWEAHPINGSHSLTIPLENSYEVLRYTPGLAGDTYWYNKTSYNQASWNNYKSKTFSNTSGSAGRIAGFPGAIQVGSGKDAGKWYNIRSMMSFNISALPYGARINSMDMRAYWSAMPAVNISFSFKIYMTTGLSARVNSLFKTIDAYNLSPSPVSFFTDNYYNGMNYPAVNASYIRFYYGLGTVNLYPGWDRPEMVNQREKTMDRIQNLDTTNSLHYYDYMNWTYGGNETNHNIKYPNETYVYNLGYYGGYGPSKGITGYHNWGLNQTALDITQWMSFLPVHQLHLQMLGISYWDMFNLTPTGDYGAYAGDTMYLRINYSGGFSRNYTFIMPPSDTWLWTEFDTWFFGIMWLLGLVIMIFTPVIAIKNYGGEGDRLMGSVYSIFMFGLGFGLFWAGLVLSNMV